MPLDQVSKQSTEEFDFAVEFYGKLPPGRSIASATVTSIDNASQANTTSAVVTPTSTVVAGTQVRWTWLAGQADGAVHKVTVRVYLDNGTGPVEKDFLLSIVDS